MDGVLTIDDLVVSAAAPVFYDIGDTTAVTVRCVCLTAPSLVLHNASLRIDCAESVSGAFTVENGNNELSVATEPHTFPSHVVCTARCTASPAFFGPPSDPSRTLSPCAHALLTDTLDLPCDAPHDVDFAALHETTSLIVSSGTVETVGALANVTVVAPGTVGTQTDAATAALTSVNTSAIPPLSTRPTAPRHRRRGVRRRPRLTVRCGCRRDGRRHCLVHRRRVGRDHRAHGDDRRLCGARRPRDGRVHCHRQGVGAPLVTLHYNWNDTVRTGPSECIEAHSSRGSATRRMRRIR